MEKRQYIDSYINKLFALWLYQASAWGAIIFILLAALDYVAATPYFRLFLVYRVAIAAILLIIAFVSKRFPPERVSVHRALGYLAIAASAATIELMILKLGGHASPYYAGMILLGICVIGFIPAMMPFHVISALLIYGIYFLPIAMTDTITDVRTFFTSNAFIIASLVSALMLRYFGENDLKRELGLKRELELQQSILEQQVNERTAQLQATVIRLEKEIAERTRAEHALQAINERLNAILQASPAAIVTLTPEGIVTLWNKAAEKMFGWTEKEAVGAFHLIVPPEKKEEFRGLRDRVMRGETYSGIEVRRRKKDDSPIDISISVAPLRDPEGNIREIMSILTDITDQIKARTALRESEEKFRTIFEESRDVFYISTPAGNFLEINPAGIELFGYASKDELLAIDIARDLYADPEDRKRFVDFVSKTGYTKDYEVQMKRRNGDRLTVQITSAAVHDDKGRLTAFRGIIRDVTEQKKLEQQLLQSQKMEAVGQLAGGIAHDFNNILTAINGYTNLLWMKLPQDDKLRAYVQHIQESADRAANLTRSLLAFSRKQVINLKPVDLNEVVRNVQKLLVRLIGEDVELVTRLSEEDLIIVADSPQLEQVLMNLSTNARDAMPGRGTFTIQTRKEKVTDSMAQQYRGMKPGSYALMTVSDSGAGMDIVTQAKIFEPFFTTKEVGKGTGLGLAMAYGIVKQHDGYIAVSSKPGYGTSFNIYLPLIEEPVRPAEPEMRREPGMQGGAETILLGEDNQTVRNITRDMLAEFGYTVIEAADGDEAIRKFLEHEDRIDLLILDVIMPKKNGREVYEAVKKIKPGVKVLFTSGYAADIIRTRGMIEEGLHFLHKPISLDALLRNIRLILEE